MTPYQYLPTSKLRPGMVVGMHGGRFVLRDDFKTHHHANAMDQRDYNMQRPVFTITGDFVGGEPVRGYFGPNTPWKFQGNDLARWAVEA